MTLVENSDFSEFLAGGADPITPPRFWEGWTTCGPAMEIKRDDTVYESAPSSVVLEGGTDCPAGTTGLKQKIRIRDVTQTSGIYRLIFYYFSSSGNIFLSPWIDFYAGGVYKKTASFPANTILASSDAWRCYDDIVEIDINDPEIDEMELRIVIVKTTSGAFTFNIDDVDFHYAFNLARKPSRPSLVIPDLATDFTRTVDRTGRMLVAGGGAKKLTGSFDFILISQDQMERLKAAFMFAKGHRFNTATIWPSLVNVTLPEILVFHWPGKFPFGYARMAGDMFTGKVTVEEI